MINKLTLGVLALYAVTVRPTELIDQQPVDEWHSPPYYPAPKGGWAPSWRASYTKAKALVEQMTLAEKVNITTAIGFEMGRCVGNTGPVERLGFPSLCAHDSPLGIRDVDLITAFPAGITVGATFNKELMYKRGLALGQEAKGKGIHILLGPCAGPLGREPAGGRNWEGFGSDPYLQGAGAFHTVSGVQDAGVQATLKHYIANEQERFRNSGPPGTLSANIDDRTLHELYLTPFAEAVRAGVAAVMCSYNTINSSHACQNSKLLNGILKDELGFQGFVMSDWLAQRSGVGSALAGLDMTQPGDGASWANGKSFWGPELSRSILNGSIPVERLNDATTRIVAAWYQLGQDKGYPKVSFSSWTNNDTDVSYKGANSGPVIVVNEHVNVRDQHALIADAVAREAITLLKNEGAVLPLSQNNIIRVFGSHAGPNPHGNNACPDKTCNVGVLTQGWGSGSALLPNDFITPIQAIQSRATNVKWYNKDNVTVDLTKLASTYNAKCIVSITSDSGEGDFTVEGNQGDRNSLYAWDNGDALVKAVADVCKSTIVLIHSVGPIIMENWIDHPNVKGVVLAHLPGQAAGYPLTDILFGNEAPSGHLPYTIGKKEDDWGQSVQIIKQGSGLIPQTFTEGLYIDYRWFDKQKIAPRFEFGFGLSYTTFEFSGMAINTLEPPTEMPPLPPPRGSVPEYNTSIPNPTEVAWPAGITPVKKYVYPYLDHPEAITTGHYPYPTGYQTEPQPEPISGGGEGGNPALYNVIYEVQAEVRNTGKVKGKAVAQLYIEFPKDTGYDAPVRQLRGFEKVELAPGEKRRVVFELTRKDLSIWDVVRQQWIIPGAGVGGYTIHIGRSSRDLPISCNTVSKACGIVSPCPSGKKAPNYGRPHRGKSLLERGL